MKRTNSWVGLALCLGVYLFMSLVVLKDLPERTAPYLASFLALLCGVIYHLERQVRMLKKEHQRGGGASDAV